MLSETLQELLSAYVDGELSPTEYERVMSALRDSAIARDYVAVLRSMSQQLKELPKYQPPAQFTKQFLQERKREQLKRRNWQFGSVAALAASLLIGVGVWWYTTQNGPVMPSPLNNAIAKNTNENSKPIVIVPDNVPVVKPQLDVAAYTQLAQEALATAYDEMEHWQDRLSGSIAWLTRAEAMREGTFQANQSTLLTGPVKLTGNLFKTLDAPLPLVQTPVDFNVTNLQNRWAKQGLFVLDLSSKDTIKTLSRLIEAGKQAKVNLVVDDEVKQRLTKKLPATFMVYLENVTEEQAIAWLKAMETVDYWKMAEARQDASCQSMLLYPLDQSGRSQVARSLGLGADQFAQPASTGSAGQAVALSYYSYRLPTSLSDEARKVIAKLQGPMKDRLSLVVMVRAGK